MRCCILFHPSCYLAHIATRNLGTIPLRYQVTILAQATHIPSIKLTHIENAFNEVGRVFVYAIGSRCSFRVVAAGKDMEQFTQWYRSEYQAKGCRLEFLLQEECLDAVWLTVTVHLHDLTSID